MMRAASAIAILLVVVAACSKSDGAPPAGGLAGAAGTATPGGPAGPGGRGGRSVTLGAADVTVVRRGSIEEGAAITGTLRPIQTVDVRARLEGDLDAVYVREGEYVRAGAILARFESLEQQSGEQSALADVAAANNEVATAQWNLDQTRELFRVGAIPERDMRAAQQTLITARARKAAADSRLRTTRLGVRDTRVLAPTSATIQTRFVEPGEHVARGAQLFTLVRNDILELAAAVPERQASSITAGQPVRFTAGGRQFEGRVARFSPTIDPASRSLTVYVQVPNATGAIKGGTFASGTVVTRTVSNALVMPLPGIRQTVGGESFVYKIVGDIVEQATVKVGIQNQATSTAEILSGLTEGDRIVVGNVGTLGRGMRVEIIGGDRPNTPAGTGTPPRSGT